MLWIEFMSICEIALRWMPQNFTDEKSTLVQVMAWTCRATSHYLSQCGPSSLSQYGTTRPQWLKWCKSVTVYVKLHVNILDTFCAFSSIFVWFLLISLPFYPSALRAGGVLSSRSGRAGGRVGGRAGGCQTCGTHISVTAWWIFSIRSSVELSRPVGVHCHGHMPICPIWACPWAKNLSNLPQIGSRLCGTHISETAGWIYPI